MLDRSALIAVNTIAVVSINHDTDECFREHAVTIFPYMQGGWSALMLAAQNGHSETCVALLGSDKYTALNNVSKVSSRIT